MVSDFDTTSTCWCQGVGPTPEGKELQPAALFDDKPNFNSKILLLQLVPDEEVVVGQVVECWHSVWAGRVQILGKT